MSFHRGLLMLILAMALNGRVHAGEIFGGHEAVPHSRPYMVYLHLYTAENKTRYCDGFLLNDDFVMTAAHCQAKSYKAFLGVHNSKNLDGDQRIPITQAFPHKAFNPSDFTNDIMLLKLSSKAKFNENVSYISLPQQCDSALPKPCLVSGWGKTSQNMRRQSDVLMEVNVTLVDDNQCEEEGRYCSEGESGPGQGDSGGPLACGDMAHGVVSCSIELSSDSFVYMYTKICDYINWINLTMSENM